MKRYFLLALFSTLYLFSNATHNRSGYITYRHVAGREYEVTITTCTKLSSSAADRPELQICWGDGTRDTITRDVIIDDVVFDVRQNLYTQKHTFPTDGVFLMEVYDPNRNMGIINITASVNEPFAITTEIVISPFVTPNNSVQFDYCPCPEFACTFQPYCFNPQAYDPDGDSLSFEMVPCRGAKDCGGDRLSCCYDVAPYMAVPVTYRFIGDPLYGGPAGVDYAGSFCWTSPTTQGEYNLAMLVTEWRKVGSTYFRVGNVTLDYQLTVMGTCENNAPSISELHDTCIVAGSTLNLTFTATDPDPLDNITVTWGGQPFEFSPDSATISVPGNGSGNSLTGTFNWATTCEHVANTAYLVTIQAKDDDQGNTGSTTVPLSTYESFSIRVIPPTVTGVTAIALGSSITVNWTPQTGCTGATGYKIYRSNSAVTNTDHCCDGSTPTDLGYTLVGTVNGVNSDEFIDNLALSVGQNYCYVVVLYYADGSVSCPSDPACDQLKAEFPLMTRVSIDVTNTTTGTDTVSWFYPYELDTTSPPYNSGNFYYELYRSPGFTLATPTLIHTTVISSSLPSLENTYFDTNINTQDGPLTYNVKLYHVSTAGVTTYVGEATPCSSIFLTLLPSDNKMTLNWQFVDTWENFYYEIYRESPTGSGTFIMIDTTSLLTYTDTGLVNGQTYCYRVKGIGGYTAPEIPSPLINWSQQTCAMPVDQTPPCPPVLNIAGDCENGINTLTWNNPNNTCADDVMQYNVYYSETDTGDYTLIQQIFTSGDTVFLHNNNGSIAGCYYVTAVDSVQYANESDSSNIVCMDNCPYYWLPNVFTPNGDGENDEFIPFPYKYIKDIDLKIFNRWGVQVFQTQDPDVKWNGHEQETNKLLIEGVYYYICTVNTIRLVGIQPIQLHGFVHLFHDSKSAPK